MKKTIKIVTLLLLFAFLTSCQDEIVVLGNENNLLPQLQQEFYAQSFSKTIPYNFNVDWNNKNKVYSEEFEKNYYEFPVIYNDDFNPSNLNALTKVSYRILVIENNKNDHRFYIAKFYEHSNTSPIEKLSLSHLDNFTGYINIFSSENELVFAKKMSDGILEGKIYKQKEFKKEFSTKASQGDDCQIKPVEHITDWYKGTFDENGNKHYEYSHSVITEITYEEVCTTNWVPQYAGYGTGAGIYRRGSSSCNDCSIVKVNNVLVDDLFIPYLSPDDPIDDISAYLSCFDTSQGAEITIYVNQPIANRDDSFTYGEDKAGHAFIGLKQVDITRVFGLYPENSATPYTPADPYAFGNNQGDEYDVSITFPIDAASLDNIIDDATTYNIDYNLNSNNCTDFVIQAAALCGESLPDPQSTWLNGGGSNPGAFGQSIRDLDLPQGMTRNNDGGNAPQNNGNCN